MPWQAMGDLSRVPGGVRNSGEGVMEGGEMGAVVGIPHGVQGQRTGQRA